MLFVTHSKIVTELMDRDTQDLKVVSGILGSGKTTILRHLEGSASEDTGIATRIRLTMENFDPGHPGDRGATASVGAVQGSYKVYAALLSEILEKTHRVEAREEFDELTRTTLRSEVYRLRVSEADWTTVSTVKPLSPQQLANAWRKAAQAVSLGFEKTWNEQDTQAFTLLLLDNFDLIADQEIGTWLTDLLPKLTGTMVVLTVDPERSPLIAPKGDASYVTIPQLTRVAVEQWLHQLNDPELAVTPALVDQICEATNGHPATLALVHEMLLVARASGREDGHPLLKNLPGSAKRPEALAERFVQALDDDDPDLSQALQIVGVPRYFNRHLFNHLLKNQGVDKRKWSRVFGRITSFAFVDNASEIAGVEKFRIHPTVRNGLMTQLIKNDYELYEALNEDLIDYYAKLLVKEDDPDSPYGAAFLYEQLKWQERKRELLYHSGLMTNERGRREALLHFCKVFLDAFFWWGAYVHFDFCDQLVADLKSLVQQRSTDVHMRAAWPELAVVQSALQSIAETYPVGNSVAEAAQWQPVQAALQRLMHQCRLEQKSTITEGNRLAQLDPVERQVSALLNVFLAATCRPDTILNTPSAKREALWEQAKSYYNRAESQFIDDWSKAWVAYHKADLAFSRNDVPGAQLDWGRSVRLRDREDNELASNLHRLYGDLVWSRGMQEEACAAYGRAVLHAYLFHFAEIRGPDEYTLQFHIDVVSHALERLRRLWNLGSEPEAIRYAIRMSSQLGPGQEVPDEATLRTLLSEGRPVALAWLLFPRAPEVHELEDPDSKFSERYRALVAYLNMDLVSDDLKS